MSIAMRRLALSLLFVCTGGAAAPGQEARPDEDDGPGLRELQQRAWRLIRATQQLDWNEQYGFMIDAVEQVYEQNGWDSESDLFSLEMVREVGALPPWEVRERLDRVKQMVGDRYLLTEKQTAEVQQLLIATNLELFSRHSERILQYALEAVETRAAGEPFTPDQVARWTALAEPVMRDAVRTFDSRVNEFAERLDPEQRALVEADLRAANGRVRDIEGMLEGWKRGEWNPADWGLDRDPIQMAAGETDVPDAVQAGPQRPQRERPQRPARRPRRISPAGVAEAGAEDGRPSARQGASSQPDDAWRRYVQEFIRKYELNDEQQQRCWLVYEDSRSRRDVFGERHERQRAAILAAGASAQAQERLEELDKRWEVDRERLFDRLKRRLDRIPTRAQRTAAGDGRQTADEQKDEEP